VARSSEYVARSLSCKLGRQ